MPKEANGKILEFDGNGGGGGLEDRVLRIEGEVSNLREDSGEIKAGMRYIGDKIDEMSAGINDRLDLQDKSLADHSNILQDIQREKARKAARSESWKKWLAILAGAGAGALVKFLAEMLFK